MNPTNTEYLLKKYPKIFVQHKLPMSQTAMCWGFECGDGWLAIIDVLCGLIQWRCDELQKKGDDFQVEATQVKEKFGGLRFYTNYEDEFIFHMIEFAEEMSYHVCEVCGTTKDAEVNKTGWLSTRCPQCRKED